MRSFNNCIKSLLIQKYLNMIAAKRGKDNEIRPIVLDLASGKGGDLLKWNKGRIGKVILTDIAKTSVEDARKRFDEMKRTFFKSEFYVNDSSKEDLRKKLKNPEMEFDLTSCQFAIHYSFESEAQAEQMVQNACQSLKTGGYFIGTTVNSKMLKDRLQDSGKKSFGNDLYNVSFESTKEFSKFGCKYVFKLENLVDCPEYVLEKDVFVKICQKYGMRLLEWKTFEQVFWENSKHRQAFALMKRMKALEVYDSKVAEKQLNSKNPGDYSHVAREVQRIKEKYPNAEPQFGTLSKREWEVSSLYVAFAFEKLDPSAVVVTDNDVDAQEEVEAEKEERIPLLSWA